ncbi:MAG: class I SAM-dependent methyltransferase [Promethearchaeota archaeon]
MNKKRFYEAHKNFSCRTISEYFISPGIKCKFDLLRTNIGSKIKFKNGIDLGSSGNSFLYFLNDIPRKFSFDIAFISLMQYSKSQLKKSSNGNFVKIWNPLCGDLTRLPYRNNSFDLVSALDVLEHIKDDELAISEISRILKKDGIAVITVPHRMKYYTNQDQLIGHYRRYEVEQILSLFDKYNLKNLKVFGVYGKFMKIADIQSVNPKKTEETLIKLRNRYESNIIFRKFWNLVVNIGARLMKIDAKYHSLKKIMNVAFIFKKQ